MEAFLMLQIPDKGFVKVSHQEPPSPAVFLRKNLIKGGLKKWQ
jgi:hypothetical protein